MDSIPEGKKVGVMEEAVFNANGQLIKMLNFGLEWDVALDLLEELNEGNSDVMALVHSLKACPEEDRQSAALAIQEYLRMLDEPSYNPNAKMIGTKILCTAKIFAREFEPEEFGFKLFEKSSMSNLHIYKGTPTFDQLNKLFLFLVKGRYWFEKFQFEFGVPENLIRID